MTLLRRARTSYPAVSILTILKRNYRRRDVLGDGGLGDGTAPLLQHGFAQPLGVALSGFHKLDYLVSHYIIGNVAAIKKPKRYQCDFICKTHVPDRLWVESVAI
jgi:hypothetical protein